MSRCLFIRLTEPKLHFMENTGKVFFADQSPQWFIALGNRYIGPMPASDVYQKIVTQEISWAHFIWRKGQANWVRVCDAPEFRVAAPSAPSANLTEQINVATQTARQAAVRPASRKPPMPGTPFDDDADSKVWYLHWNDTQYGPFSAFEIQQMIVSGRIGGRHYLWKENMTKWERLERVAQFASQLKAAPSLPPVAPTPRNKRTEPRKPLIAKIFLANDESLVSAVCRDISVGGMQVLTDKVPGQVGTKIKMNVSPAEKGKASATKGNFKPFVAEGVIVRILEDGRGFSFRFDKISDAAKRSIAAYVIANA